MPDDISRRSFLAAAGAAAAAAGLSACGTSAGSASGSITLWSGFQEIQQEQFFKQQYINPWNKSHPSTLLDLTVKPLNTLTQLQQTAVGAGQGPDLLQENGSSTVIPLAQPSRSCRSTSTR